MARKRELRLVHARKEPSTQAEVIWTYRITLKVETDVPRSAEPDGIVEDIEVEIWAHAESGTKEYAGRAKATRIYLGQRMNERLTDPLLDVFDAHSADLLELYVTLFDEETEELRDGISDTGEPDLLYIDAVELLPQHRGAGLGLHVVRRIVDLFGEGCAAVILEPSPLLYDHDPERQQQMAPSSFTTDARLAQKKLERYWSNLGFERFEKTRYLVFDPSMRPPDLSRLRASPLR